MKRTAKACAGACLLSILVLSADVRLWAADSDRVIWVPSKTGKNAYKLRMGARFSGRWEASGGAEVSVSATKAGKVQQAPPAGFWGLFSRRNGEGTARATSQDVNIQFNAASGAGNVGVSSTRRWIATRRLDVETRRSLSFQCNAYEGRCRSARFSHSARLAAVQTGTALVAQGAVDNGRLHALDSLGIEQTFGKLSLGAAVRSPMSTPRGAFTARYALNW